MTEQPEAGARWPVVRHGDREPLDPILWAAVGARDDWACRICHTDKPTGRWEIDHIIPWSAGGSDETTNLRLTCAPCNQRRRNYADPFARPSQPVIDQCTRYGDEPTVRVWCNRHRRWESAPPEYAERHELSRTLTRPGGPGMVGARGAAMARVAIAQASASAADTDPRNRAIARCGMCDDRGYLGSVVCDHETETAAAGRRGAARARAALAAALHADDPTGDPT